METDNKESIVKDSDNAEETVITEQFLEQPNTELILSKRQLKKIKKREKWMKTKSEKRLKERAKAKEKRALAKANNVDLGPSRKYLKTCTMLDSPCKLNVTIDLSFDDFMISKDIAKLIKQILRCYTLNRRAVAPLQFSISCFDGKSYVEMKKHNGYENWDIKFHEKDYLNIFPKDQIVYLTSESENVIEELNHDCVYVIGGLVDHNQHKGLCHKLAVEKGVKHGRLPLDKYLEMKARKVLTVDHVFEIILRVTEGKTWQEAFLQVLPERKNAKLVNMDQLTNSEDSQESMTLEVHETNQSS